MFSHGKIVCSHRAALEEDSISLLHAGLNRNQNTKSKVFCYFYIHFQLVYTYPTQHTLVAVGGDAFLH